MKLIMFIKKLFARLSYFVSQTQKRQTTNVTELKQLTNKGLHSLTIWAVRLRVEDVEIVEVW